MNILYYDNCWFTNVGEAFIDIGAMSLIRKLYPDAHIANISNMSKYYFPRTKKKFLNIIKHENGNQGCPFNLDIVVEHWKYDLLILAGMFMTELHLQGKVCEFVRKSVQAGAKVAFIGLGAEPNIKKETIEKYNEYIKEISPLFITTRDEKTYNFLKTGGCSGLVCGLDAAFWCKDCYDPRGFSKLPYDIVTFNRSTEPKIFSKWEKKIIRPWHMQSESSNTLFMHETFISDIPFDYISLYANAEKVYTDLVHATIISLQYGKKVKYYKYDDRSDSFLDLRFLKKDGDGMLYIDENDLEIEKKTIQSKIEKLKRGR